jgi:hypothetical protein
MHGFDHGILVPASTVHQLLNLHDVLLRPLDGVGVEVCGGVEPEAELLLLAAGPAGEDVGVQRVRLAGHVAQELEVHLVVGVPRALGQELHQKYAQGQNLVQKSPG